MFRMSYCVTNRFLCIGLMTLGIYYDGWVCHSWGRETKYVGMLFKTGVNILSEFDFVDKSEFVKVKY